MCEKATKKEIANQYVKASVHYGHPPKEWNPKMAPYILYAKYGYHIFDLVKTSKLLRLAGNVLEKKAQKGGKFLFVGTNRLSSSIVAKQALRCDSYYINYRWLGGMLTNWQTVKTRIERLKKLEQQEEDGLLEILPKKEASSIRKELEKLKKNLNGIKNMPRIPDILIVVDQRRELTAIKEAISLNLPIVSILDTNCDPDLIDIPIPGNDDSIGSIKLILKTLSKSILNGTIKS